MKELNAKIVADYFEARANRLDKSIAKAERKRQIQLLEGRKNTQAIYRFVANRLRGDES